MRMCKEGMLRSSYIMVEFLCSLRRCGPGSLISGTITFSTVISRLQAFLCQTHLTSHLVLGAQRGFCPTHRTILRCPVEARSRPIAERPLHVQVDGALDHLTYLSLVCLRRGWPSRLRAPYSRGSLHGAVHEVRYTMGVGVAGLDGYDGPTTPEGVEIPLRLIRGDAVLLQHLEQAGSRRIPIRA
jgi:hypothetical protein